jgi:hypothetical protein
MNEAARATAAFVSYQKAESPSEMPDPAQEAPVPQYFHPSLNMVKRGPAIEETNMAHLSIEELEEALAVIGDGGSAAAVRDKFVRLGAFHSRRGLGDYAALARRVFTLSAGLRREVPTTAAFQALWSDYMHHRLSEESGGKLDELAEAINESIGESGVIKDGQKDALEGALATYEDFLASKVGGKAARFDTLQKAFPEVAELLRARAIPEVALVPDEHDHHDHDEH